MAPTCVKGDIVPKGWCPLGRDILTRDEDIIVCPLPFVAEGCVAHCGMTVAMGLLKMEDMGIWQDIIPDVGQVELAYVSIKGWFHRP